MRFPALFQCANGYLANAGHSINTALAKASTWAKPEGACPQMHGDLKEDSATRREKQTWTLHVETYQNSLV